MRRSRDKKVIWDYDIKKMDLKNPEVLVWYLSRKIRFGDFSRIKAADIKKYLPKLDIDKSMKKLIRNYLKIAR